MTHVRWSGSYRVPSTNSGVELDHAVDQLQLRGVMTLLNVTRISLVPGSTPREPDTGSVITTTGGKESTPFKCWGRATSGGVRTKGSVPAAATRIKPSATYASV